MAGRTPHLVRFDRPADTFAPGAQANRAEETPKIDAATAGPCTDCQASIEEANAVYFDWLFEEVAKAREQFVEAAFSHVNLDWHDYVVIDPKFYRPAEVDLLVADPSKAKRELGWEPAVRFEELVAMMVDADLAELGGEETQQTFPKAA